MQHAKGSSCKTSIKPFHISLEECFSTFHGTLRPYQKQSIIELIDSFKNGRDAAFNLPTGTGKTIVFLSVAIAAADLGCSVAVLVATNQIIDQIVQKYLPMFSAKTAPAIVKGIEHYRCLITGENADYGICTAEKKVLCASNNPDCPVLKVNKDFQTHNFILTNFHKFLSERRKNNFDLIIIDDSHGFENALDDKFQSRISYYQLEGLFKRHDQPENAVADFAGAFLDYFDDAFNSIPLTPNTESMRVPNDIIKNIGSIKSTTLEAQMGKLDELDRSICRTAAYFVQCCQNTSLNVVYVQKDHYNLSDRQEAALIARKSKSYQKDIVKKKFDNSRIIFASATFGDILTHANYCTFKSYTEDMIAVIPKTTPGNIRNWFKGLSIYETKDFPQSSDGQIEKAAETALEILKIKGGKTLLLFKSYRDQEKARNILRNINREITFIDDSFESETVQRYVQEADIIMASASSRLWEGIDINDLKLEIIFSLPFIRPPVHLDKKDGFLFTKRKMLIRLQQGIGRLIRKEDDEGVCVIMDNRLEKYKNSSNFSEAYRERIQLVNTAKLLERLQANKGETS